MKKILLVAFLLLTLVATVYADAVVTRIAYSGSNPIYIGKAQSGAATSSSSWQIKRLTYSGSDVTTIEFADGDEKYNNVWDNRASLTYR